MFIPQPAATMRATLFAVCVGFLFGTFVFAWNSTEVMYFDTSLSATFDVVSLVQNNIQSTLNTKALQIPYPHINNHSSSHHLTVILSYRNRETNVQTMGTPIPSFPHDVSLQLRCLTRTRLMVVKQSLTLFCSVVQCHTCISI